jgi:hypothetical protein
MTAEQILRCKQPGDLFSCPEKLDDEFKALSKEWHPDKNKDPQAAKVMAVINELHDIGKKMVSAGVWEAEGKKIMKLDDGKTLIINFDVEKMFELGTMYVGDANVVFLIKKEHKALVENYRLNVKSFKFASSRMKDDMKKYLPRITTELKTSDGDYVVAINKTEDVFLLESVLKYHGDRMDPRHVAWIMSGLYNNCCYLRYLGIAHNGFAVDSYFISPEFHSGLMLGGWWYTLPIGKKISCLPKDVYAVMPPSMRDKKSSPLLDLECVKLIGRTLLGDKNGTSLVKDKDIPAPLTTFLRNMSSDDALEEYKKWGQVLTDSFGKRRFVKMDLDKQGLYNKLKEKK